MSGNKTAVVTGGRGGIGHAIAERLNRDGCNVVTIDINAANSQYAATSSMLHLQADLTSRSQIEQAMERVQADFGAIDILVNSAGVVSFGSAASLEEAEWDRVLAINLKAVFHSCQLAMPMMKAKRWGRIINIGSILAKNGGNARPWIDAGEQARSSNAAYAVSKAGVHTLTLYLARELASFGITVNVVAPGPIESAMTKNFPDALKALIPLGRMGKATDVASAVAFLASAEASFITGEILDINGGAWAD